MSKREAEQLIDRYLQGTCTEEERGLVEQYFLEYLNRNEHESDKETIDYIGEEMREIIAGRISKGSDGPIRKKPGNNMFYLSIAASILVLMAFAVFYFPITVSKEPKLVQGTTNDIAPGGNKATLVLDNGSSISLSPSQDGIVISSGDIKYANGENLGLDSGFHKRNTTQKKKLQYAFLSTPKGGQYQVTLSDGTKVWLNAESKLKYPIRFSSDKREVELDGEAYFDVSKSLDTHTGERLPFIVKTRQQEVEVLGTAFNVNAYIDNAYIKTTLVEGMVQVKVDDTQFKTVLQPNYQTVLMNNQLTTYPANIAAETSWKSGIFDFTGKTLPEVLKQLQRWYDLDIQYSGDVPEMKFWGRIYRNNNLSDVLKILESAQVKFHIGANRQLIIDNNNR